MPLASVGRGQGCPKQPIVHRTAAHSPPSPSKELSDPNVSSDEVENSDLERLSGFPSLEVTEEEKHGSRRVSQKQMTAQGEGEAERIYLGNSRGC